jgi:hypothetical protein
MLQIAFAANLLSQKTGKKVGRKGFLLLFYD